MLHLVAKMEKLFGKTLPGENTIRSAATFPLYFNPLFYTWFAGRKKGTEGGDLGIKSGRLQVGVKLGIIRVELRLH
jgi:hypothetical protein